MPWTLDRARQTANEYTSVDPDGPPLQQPPRGLGASDPRPHPTARMQVSHLVYEVESLASACDVFEQITGVRPILGSRYDALGIHNALVGLGGGRYLELLAQTQGDSAVIRRGEGNVAPVSILGISGEKPRLATWCCDAGEVGLTGIVADLCRLPLKGTFPAEIKLISRPNPSGGRLTWRLAADKQRDVPGGVLPMGGLVPYLLDWVGDSSKKPGNVAPKGCELVELQGEHPQASDVMAVLRAMRADHLIQMVQGSKPRMSAVISHPRGQLVLE